MDCIDGESDIIPTAKKRKKVRKSKTRSRSKKLTTTDISLVDILPDQADKTDESKIQSSSAELLHDLSVTPSGEREDSPDILVITIPIGKETAQSIIPPVATERSVKRNTSRPKIGAPKSKSKTDGKGSRPIQAPNGPRPLARAPKKSGVYTFHF